MGIIGNVLAYVRHSIRAGGARESLPPELHRVFSNKRAPIPGDLSRITRLRRQLLLDKRTIEVEDHGAGATGQLPGELRRISSIVRNTRRSKRNRMLHYHLVKYSEPTVVLELGTSLGLTTALLATAAPEATIYTIEGCRNTAALASTHFKTLGLTNINQKIGDFDLTLDPLLREIHHVDYVFIDGNHRMVPTLNYFLKLLPYIRQKSIFVFDDIHWSKEMNETWEEIKKHPRVTLSVELFNTGVLFFHEQYTKKGIILR